MSEERLEEIKEEYEWNVENGLLPRTSDDNFEWLIEQAERAETLEMKYENSGSMFNRQNMQTRIDELEKEQKKNDDYAWKLLMDIKRYREVIKISAHELFVRNAYENDEAINKVIKILAEALESESND